MPHDLALLKSGEVNGISEADFFIRLLNLFGEAFSSLRSDWLELTALPSRLESCISLCSERDGLESGNGGRLLSLRYLQNNGLIIYTLQISTTGTISAYRCSLCSIIRYAPVIEFLASKFCGELRRSAETPRWIRRFAASTSDCAIAPAGSKLTGRCMFTSETEGSMCISGNAGTGGFASAGVWTGKEGFCLSTALPLGAFGRRILEAFWPAFAKATQASSD